MPRRSSQIDTNVKIKEISQIHNIRYEEGGMRFWKAFDIGKGERMVQDNMPSIEIPKVKVVQAFPEACFSSGTMARSSKHTEEEKASPTDTENVERNALFECPSDGCTSSFGSETELQRHLDVGNHVRRLHRESQFDYIRLRYADMVNEELSKPLFGANYPSESQHSGKGVSNEGLPGGVLVPLFPSNIALCSHVPTHFRNLFPFYQIHLPPTPSLLTFLHKKN